VRQIKEVINTNSAKTNENRRIEDRILDLEIKMTTMHNLLIKIANKIEYWEEMEGTGNPEEEEPMDTEHSVRPENTPHSGGSIEETPEVQYKQKHLHQPEAQEETTEKINRRQEKLENNMTEMMGILGNIAIKFNRLGETPQRPEYEKGPLNQQQQI
jgi:hypothetical protein